jgi:O-methyltransferase involved in polyketide biosynthesis
MASHFTSNPALNLSGVPETMLWTLHNRASEAVRPDAFLNDPEAVRVYRQIPYDYVRNFGKPDESHPMRSRLFDRAVRPWILEHPGATVVELACGLETQFYRCDDGEVQWCCVDLPEALDVRARFLPAGPRCRFIRKSAMDLTWMDQVDARRGLFVTAQGLFMYFEEREVYQLLHALFERFPGVELMFDAIPVWFSRRTLRGFQKTKFYRAPRMPWGIDHDDIEPALRRVSPRVRRVQVQSYGAQRSLLGFALRLFSRLPKLRNIAPTVVRVSTV